MTRESYYLRILGERGCDRVVKYYGDAFCQGLTYIKVESTEIGVAKFSKGDIMRVRKLAREML